MIKSTEPILKKLAFLPVEYLHGFLNQKQMYSSQHKEMKGHTKRENCILKLASSPFWSMEP